MSRQQGHHNVIGVRDDSGIHSLSMNERDFIRNCALSSPALRLDGREENSIRNVRIELGRWDNGSQCTLQWGGGSGGTRVTCNCVGELAIPSMDRPSEGLLSISLDLSPMASTSYDYVYPVPSTKAGGGGGGGGSVSASQKLLCNRILRCLERIIIMGGNTLDLETLCEIPGQYVWEISLGLTVLDDGGNLMDACVLAAMAALRHYRKPHVKFDTIDTSTSSSSSNNNNNNDTGPAVVVPTFIPAHMKEPTPLPLHHTPLCTSFKLIPTEHYWGSKSVSAITASQDDTGDDNDNGDDYENNKNDNTASSSLLTVLIDPTHREELIPSGTLTIAMNLHQEICLLDYPGGCELPTNIFLKCVKWAQSSTQQLCTILEEALKQADEQALSDLLKKLQLQQQKNQLSSSSSVKQDKGVEINPDIDDNDDDIAMDDVPVKDGVPFFQADGTQDVDMDDNNDNDNKDTIQSQAEEAYRRQVLDFNQSHMTAKVRENNDSAGSHDNNKKKHKNTVSRQNLTKAGSLLQAMLQSATVAAAESTETEADAVQQEQEEAKKEEKQEKEALKTTKEGAASSQKKKTKAIKTKVSPATNKQEKDTTPSSKQKDKQNKHDLDSDEEETTTMLESEFASQPQKTPATIQPPLPPPPPPASKTPPSKAPVPQPKMDDDNDDDDIDDLAKAITSKKKKKKRKK